ncbi:hypothetical protein PIROE2DRAFT_6228, partial [Piromyces sp. E2]
KLEKLEEERKEKDIIDEDESQSQSEYILASTSSLFPSFAPKLRRSYSQQLKKMSKSPRLSFIQPKIQPQAQDNYNRGSNINNRLSTVSSTSITNSPSNYKVFRSTIQNYNNTNNKKSFIDNTLIGPTTNINVSNSNNDCSSVPASPVAILKRNVNNCHKNSLSNINYNIFDGNDRSLINPECNKFEQSESTIMNTGSSNRISKSNPLDERNSMDYINKNSTEVISRTSMEYMNRTSMEYINKNSLEFMNKTSSDCINENSSLLINLCISGSNIKAASTTSISNNNIFQLYIYIFHF